MNEDTLSKVLDKVGKRTLVEGHVQMERQDKRHRMGRLLAAAHDIYTQRKPAQAFYDWLDAMPEWERIVMLSNAIKQAGIRCQGSVQQNKWLDKNPHLLDQTNLNPSIVRAFLRGVAYLDSVTRPNYQVELRAGRAFYRGVLLDTSNMRTVFSGQGFGIWVMDPAGNLYAANHILGQMHHSSFLAGDEIRAGGELKVKNGKIELLSGKSGHYAPEMVNLVGALCVLKHQGVAVADIRVLVWREKTPKIVRGSQLLASAEGYVAWGGLSERQKLLLQQEQYAEFE